MSNSGTGSSSSASSSPTTSGSSPSTAQPGQSSGRSRSGSQRGSGASADGGVGEAQRDLHAARTTVPDRDVDARLDNRTVAQLRSAPRPGLNDPKPQHVDGPDLAGQVAHTRAVLAGETVPGAGTDAHADGADTTTSS